MKAQRQQIAAGQRAVSALNRLYRRGRADRWSALFGQVAVYSFAVTAITGVFLLFFYKPSMTQVTYHGSYRQLDGVPVSEAYMLFTGLQRHGVPSKLLYFPDENHWILKPPNSRVWHETIFEWLDRYLAS